MKMASQTVVPVYICVSDTRVCGVGVGTCCIKMAVFMCGSGTRICGVGMVHVVSRWLLIYVSVIRTLLSRWLFAYVAVTHVYICK